MERLRPARGGSNLGADCLGLRAADDVPGGWSRVRLLVRPLNLGGARQQSFLAVRVLLRRVGRGRTGVLGAALAAGCPPPRNTP